MRIKTIVLSIFFIIGCTNNSGTAPGTDSVTTVAASVTVNMSSTSGTYRDVLGINKAPRGTDSQSIGANTYNLVELYKSFGISTVRALDSYFDVCSIYNDDTVTNVATSATLTNCTNAQGTHAMWTSNSSGANVNNSSSYTFTTVDSNLDAIYNSGAGLYLRLGENNNGPNDTTDYSNWATVAKNLYKHVSGVNGGFGSAPTHTMTPLYIEIFNEPDGGFWMGSKANFMTLYNTTWDAIDAIAASNVKIGGPAFTTTFKDHLSIAANVASSFVSSVTTSRLDFLSAHVYGSCDSATLSEMASQITYLRSYMNSNGLTSKPLILSEWNIGLDCSSESSFHSQRAQGFNGAMMSLMQDTTMNIEKSMIYGGFGQMSFFTLDTSNVGVVTIHPGAWAFKAHAQLSGGTLLATQNCDSSNSCLSGINSYSSPLQSTAVSLSGQTKVVLSNDSASNATTTLQLQNWSGSTSPTITQYSYPTSAVTVSASSVIGIYTVSSGSMSSLMSSSIQSSTLTGSVNSGTLTTTLTVPAYSTVLVTVQ